MRGNAPSDSCGLGILHSFFRSHTSLQTLRVGHSSRRTVTRESEWGTPPSWRTESSFDDLAIVVGLRRQGSDAQEGDTASSEVGDSNMSDGTTHRRLSCKKE